MNSLPFDMPGHFYRGNLHTHSDCSDGALATSQVVQVYRDAGYDFIALTDHFLERYGWPVTDTRALRTDNFTTLLGAELHAPEVDTGGPWHIVATGLPLDFEPPAPAETGPELAKRAAAAGAFIGIAHPAWYGLTLSEAQTMTAAHAVEIYNETCARLNDRGDSWYLCDALLSGGRHLTAYAADDAHFVGRPDSCAAWVQVRAERLDPVCILAALKAGYYYSSQGPEIHDITIEDSQISVDCSPARAVFVTGRGAAAQSRLGEDLSHCTLSLESFAGSYCRVTVVDPADKRAWSNPIWLPR